MKYSFKVYKDNKEIKRINNLSYSKILDLIDIFINNNYSIFNVSYKIEEV